MLFTKIALFLVLSLKKLIQHSATLRILSKRGFAVNNDVSANSDLTEKSGNFIGKDFDWLRDQNGKQIS